MATFFEGNRKSKDGERRPETGNAKPKNGEYVGETSVSDAAMPIGKGWKNGDNEETSALCFIFFLPLTFYQSEP